MTSTPAALPFPDAVAIMRAAKFGAEKHRNQRRKDPDASPYINHPIDLAHELMNTGGVGDAVTLCAALLHDEHAAARKAMVAIHTARALLLGGLGRTGECGRSELEAALVSITEARDALLSVTHLEQSTQDVAHPCPEAVLQAGAIG